MFIIITGVFSKSEKYTGKIRTHRSTGERRGGEAINKWVNKFSKTSYGKNEEGREMRRVMPSEFPKVFNKLSAIFSSQRAERFTLDVKRKVSKITEHKKKWNTWNFIIPFSKRWLWKDCYFHFRTCKMAPNYTLLLSLHVPIYQPTCYLSNSFKGLLKLQEQPIICN